ncbi:hypothetical protein NL676_002224 [Syzygium grande]|nr:hypothetical protein NL676_002224 [Syzygium grande]
MMTNSRTACKQHNNLDEITSIQRILNRNEGIKSWEKRSSRLLFGRNLRSGITTGARARPFQKKKDLSLLASTPSATLRTRRYAGPHPCPAPRVRTPPGRRPTPSVPPRARDAGDAWPRVPGRDVTLRARAPALPTAPERIRIRAPIGRFAKGR